MKNVVLKGWVFLNNTNTFICSLTFFIDMCQTKSLILYSETGLNVLYTLLDYWQIVKEIHVIIFIYQVIIFFTSKDKFVNLLWDIWIKQHFPLLSPLIYLSLYLKVAVLFYGHIQQKRVKYHLQTVCQLTLILQVDH